MQTIPINHHTPGYRILFKQVLKQLSSSRDASTSCV
uniref:Uncharacterized protein n=1 Tax=Rhizophora mucronata TaxID=61149 RepID=A0A2P2N988_RHIMU